MFNLRSRCLGLSACFFFLAAGLMVSSLALKSMDAADSKAARLEQLLQEKLNLLENAATQIDARHKAGFAGLEEVYEAHQTVERARLDLCKTDEERIAVLERMLTKAKHREETLSKSSAIAAHDIIQTKVDRLDIEISLERIRSK
jgi:hypothetical protein